MAEDNLADTVLVRQAIRAQDLPLDIYIASDGQAALDFIRRAESDPQAPCPHFLLLDINLPRKNGFEVLRGLRESKECGAIPVVVMTSSNSVADMNGAMELGAQYFHKPTDYDQFMKIGTVLKGLIKGAQTGKDTDTEAPEPKKDDPPSL